MRILILASWYPDKQKPGRGIFFREQAEALAAVGHVVTVMVPERRSPRRYLSLESKRLRPEHGFEACDENEVRVYRNRATRFLPAGLFPILVLREFERDALELIETLMAERGPFDIIHAQSVYWAGAIAMAMADRLDVPYIIQEHRSNFLSGSFGKKTMSVIKEAFDRASYIVAVSEGLLAALRKASGVPTERSAVLPNMVNAIFFRRTPRSRSKVFRFGMVAGLVPIKRHDLALYALKRILETRNEVELHLAGEGPSRRFLENLSRDLGIQEKVTWHGHQSREEVVDLFNGLDALLLASDHETFGIVLAEAWASGVPVVATRCGGPDLIVTPSNGILVDKGSVDALVSGMLDLIHRRNDFDDEAIRQDALAKYGEASIIQLTLKIYEEAMRRYRNAEER